jgi:hypothetical protein
MLRNRSGATGTAGDSAGPPLLRSARANSLDRGVRQSNIEEMGFNRRKMEDNSAAK